MTLLRCRNITKAFGEQDVLCGINFEISKGNKIGLVGYNGAGKSTLANILVGLLKPDSGQIEYGQKHVRIGYLKQNATFELFEDEQPIQLNNKETKEYWEIASHLGVDDWHGERLNHLSGGEKTKLALAIAWSTKPDLLILDEPTNHLDFQGVEWLVEELNSCDVSVIIISHDRYFLDQTVQLISEIDEGKLIVYKGNYTAYRNEKKIRYESQLHHYYEQKKVEAHIEQEIARLKEWSAKGHREAGKVGKMAEMRMGVKEFHRKKAKMMDRQVKSRIKRLEKIELEGVKKPKEDSKVFFEWNQTEKRGKSIVLAEKITKSFDQQPLFEASSFFVQRGEKIGIVGPNGCGKTTLLQMIGGHLLPDSGQLWTSPNIKISRLEQDVRNRDNTMTVNNYIKHITTTAEQFSDAITILMNMGFTQPILRKSIQALSHGENLRLNIAQLVLEQQHILVLDEPTNHLDLIYREQLEQTLLQYNGTLIVVSHDRYFLETICDKLLVFEDGKIERKEFTFKDYMERRRIIKDGGGTKEKLTDHTEAILVINNEIAFILGELAKHEADSKEYEELDTAFKALLQKKKTLMQDTKAKS